MLLSPSSLSARAPLCLPAPCLHRVGLTKRPQRLTLEGTLQNVRQQLNGREVGGTSLAPFPSVPLSRGFVLSELGAVVTRYTPLRYNSEVVGVSHIYSSLLKLFRRLFRAIVSSNPLVMAAPSPSLGPSWPLP